MLRLKVWDRAAAGQTRNLDVLSWETPEQLEARMLEMLQRYLPLTSVADECGFGESLGGSVFREAVYFHAKSEKNPMGAAEKVERWQILSPVRAGAHGVDALNRTIQARFRRTARQWADKREYARVPKPMGAQEILYGDKVISVVNGVRYDVWPKPEERAYVANGDIGIVVGEYESKPSRYRSRDRIQVEFTSRPGYRHGYKASEFGEEGTAPLELAYALTIHRAQGSEFGITFVVVPAHCRLLSRELLYTALTRQSERVVLLVQGDLHALRDLGSETRSEVARRLTNLFSAPALYEHANGFLVEGLIHRTRRGELVRSKSELMMANILHELGAPYEYERPLKAPDGSVRYPDFTVDDAESGTRLYIEHLGMLDQPQYRARWEAKLLWYQAQGIRRVEDGGGPGGALLITTDAGAPSGDAGPRGFDEPALRARVAKALGQ